MEWLLIREASKKKCDDKVKNRIKRTAGQLNGILTMIEEERSCEDVVIQLLAVQSNVEKLIGIITTNNLLQSIEKEHDIKLDNLEKEVDLVLKRR